MWRQSLTFALGERPRTSPPERVRALIDAQQVKSEILIGWVEFALVAFFVALYVLAPKTSAGTRFLPVLWVLGAFFAVAGLRLVNKSYGTYVLAAESTVRAAGGAFSFERVGEVMVRGRSAPTTVYTPARIAGGRK